MLPLLCSLLPGVVAAEDQNDNGFSLDEAVSKIRSQSNGRILSAKTADNNGERIHQIRVLTKDGRVQRFEVKAKHKGKQLRHKRQR